MTLYQKDFVGAHTLLHQLPARIPLLRTGFHAPTIHHTEREVTESWGRAGHGIEGIDDCAVVGVRHSSTPFVAMGRQSEPAGGGTAL